MNILLVDDSDLFRKALERVLARVLEHNVWAVSNLEDARNALINGSFDVLITDTEMPTGWEGPTLIKLAQEEKPNVLCILMSGNLDNRAKADELGVTFLPKPFALAELKEALKT